MVAIGLGTQSQIQQQIQNRGTNILVVTSGSSSSGGVSRGGSFNRLTLDDAEGNDQDDVVFAPYTTVKKRLSGRSFIAQILASTSSPDDIPEAQEELALIMRESHELAAWEEDDFTVRNQTERTREICIRMAIGIGVGFAGASLIGRFTGWATTISPATVVVALVFSAAVGIFFGYYPARKPPPSIPSRRCVRVGWHWAGPGFFYADRGLHSLGKTALTDIIFSPAEIWLVLVLNVLTFLFLLTLQVPPPGVHMVRYYGHYSERSRASGSRAAGVARQTRERGASRAVPGRGRLFAGAGRVG